MIIKKATLATSFLFALLCVVIPSFANGSKEKRNETVMGDFAVPTLTGWKPVVFRSGQLSNVRFTTQVDKTSLLIVFSYFKTMKGLEAPTAKDLQENEAYRQKMLPKMDKNAKTASKTLLSRPTRFRNWPAYTTVVHSSTNNAVTRTQVLRFVDGKNQYWISISHTAKPLSPKAKKVADAGWKQLTTELRRLR